MFQAPPLSCLNPLDSYKFSKYTFIPMSNLCGLLKVQPYLRDHEYMQSISICFAFFIHQTTSTNNLLSRKVTLKTWQMGSHNWRDFFFKTYHALTSHSEFNHSPCIYCKEKVHNKMATVHAVACQSTETWHEFSKFYTRARRLRIWLQD